eukprot:6017291-Prorocentrum_lima.AAC.1
MDINDPNIVRVTRVVLILPRELPSQQTLAGVVHASTLGKGFLCVDIQRLARNITLVPASLL